MNEAAELTKTNKKLVFTIAFNYGGQAEIVDAVKRLIDDGVPADKVDEKAIATRLYDPEMPPVDLMVRTSGEYRISNFLLWELAYSELYFTDTLWPDFTRSHFKDAVADFQHRARRYGGV
jgi:undecaprenyl diphosphate synthase